MFSPYIANHNLFVNYITFLKCYKYYFFVIYLSLTAKSRGITFLCPYSTSYLPSFIYQYLYQHSLHKFSRTSHKAHYHQSFPPAFSLYQRTLYSKTDDFTITHIHKWIQIKLVHCHMSLSIHFIIFKLRCIGSYFLMRYINIKSPANSVWCNLSDFPFIRTVFPTLSSEGYHLKAKFLHKPLYLFLVNSIALFPKFA